MSLGIGKITFNGVDITQSPYYAHLAPESQYWWLDAYTSEQIAIGPNSLITPTPTVKEWKLALVLQIVPPHGSRELMIQAMIELAALFHTSEDGYLVFDEFPNSYFKARRISSSVESDEGAITKLNLEMACTGPAYSIYEAFEPLNIINSEFMFMLNGDGDVPASPRYRLTLTPPPTFPHLVGMRYTGDISIENVTYGEKITWNGTLNQGSTLEFILGEEYGTPFSVLLNGQNSISTVTGPAWPHVYPGANVMRISGPTIAVGEARWHNRWLVGQHYATRSSTDLVLTVDHGTPNLGDTGTFVAYLSSDSTPLAYKQIKIGHYLGGEIINDLVGETDIHGQVTMSRQFYNTGTFRYFATFEGDDRYKAAISSTTSVSISVQTRVGSVSVSPTVVANTSGKITASGILQWYDVSRGVWENGSAYGVTANQKIKVEADIYGLWGKERTNTYYVTTDGNGVYSCPLTFSQTGDVVVRASYVGDQWHSNCNTGDTACDVGRPMRLVVDSYNAAITGYKTWSETTDYKIFGTLYQWDWNTQSWQTGVAVGGLIIHLWTRGSVTHSATAVLLDQFSVISTGQWPGAWGTNHENWPVDPTVAQTWLISTVYLGSSDRQPCHATDIHIKVN